MNYISEINAFQECVIEFELKPQEIALWYALMQICNRTGWKEEFNASRARLSVMTGMSESSIQRARTRLEELGMITCIKRGGCQSAVYRMQSLTDKTRQQCRQDKAAVRECETELETQDAVTEEPEGGATVQAADDEQNDWNNRVRNVADQVAGQFVVHTDSQSDPQPDRQSGRIHKHKQKHIYLSDSAREENFRQFWESYPLHSSENNARQQYAVLVQKGVPDQNLLDAAKNYALDCRLKNVPERYIKHAANWLKEEVYVDYLPGNWKCNIVEYKKSKPLSSKHNCGSREYDYEELERQLLAKG